MRLHLVGLPHTEFDRVTHSSCAFTAKSVRFVEMLDMIGIDVVVYWGGEAPSAHEHHFVSLLHRGEQEAYFGKWDPAALPVVEWDVSLDYWQSFNERAMDSIEARLEPGDTIGVVGGSISQCVVDRFSSDYTCLEVGVGYEGICQDTFACFESYAWMHNRYGAYNIGNGRAFDTVIPNAVDPNDFAVDSDDGYLLFIGRMINRKGPHVAAQIAKEMGLPLKMVGTGVTESGNGRIVTTDGTVIDGADVEYLGPVGPARRKTLLSHASALLVPTLYIGPWEGVHAEALMSGVVPVTPDYGVFTETMGREYRYRSFKEAVEATDRAINDRSRAWRDYATSTFGLNVCARRYEQWFQQLSTLSGAGWYTI